MPQMGSQIAAEYAAGQSAASDVYIGADSYLAPLVKHKLFHESIGRDCCPGRITNEMVEGGRTSLRVYTGLPGFPTIPRRTPNNDAPKSLKDMLKPQWKGKIASTPYVTSLNILACQGDVGQRSGA